MIPGRTAHPHSGWRNSILARKKMFYSSAKAIAELGYHARPAREAIQDAVAWFRAEGMLRS